MTSETHIEVEAARSELANASVGCSNGALLLKPADAAATLAIGKRKLWTLTNRGDIPHVRIGRAVRYRREDLQAFIEKNYVARRER